MNLLHFYLYARLKYGDAPTEVRDHNPLVYDCQFSCPRQSCKNDPYFRVKNTSVSAQLTLRLT